MPMRLGRIMREMLSTVLDLQACKGSLSSIEIELFAHSHRKALREMRRARQLARLSKREHEPVV